MRSADCTDNRKFCGTGMKTREINNAKAMREFAKK